MYKITFEDNTIFKGGEPENSKWNDMPDKPIKSIRYQYRNQIIILEGYEEYNHIKEMRNFLFGGSKGFTQLILMARNDKESRLFIWDLLRGGFYTKVTEIDNEYNNKKVTGWKKGLTSRKPTYKIIQDI